MMCARTRIAAPGLMLAATSLAVPAKATTPAHVGGRDRRYVFGDLSPGGRGLLAISSMRPASWLSCHLRASAAALCQVGVCAAIFGSGAFLSMGMRAGNAHES